MLAANVLCLKKKKRRTYCVSNVSTCKGNGASTSHTERSRGGTATMMQITEDTPPDMLAGAMDLTVHLPNGSAVKMAVERGTPMMDLLVQITTANHLQLSNHTLQALGMAPSSEHSDKILPFKPNTPIGALDTQHIRVLPKGRTLPAPKYTAPGHQPFESTFRLKVHLPRNQLYVTRVGRNVLLEDIMKKVCEEKNLDPVKYEFKHPGNLDQALDPKLTLSDYQITEIYVVVKGTTNLSQAFSAADIMVLRKEEERKQMHTKTGGGVFNLIFKRGKSSIGSGSVSSENRSISPTHSDDSRSVTPPAVQAPPIVAPPKKEPPLERPKPPQRKRRPAPRPPQNDVADESNDNKGEKSSSVGSNEDPSNHSSQKSNENGLTICHSRNSSDSSGYHEASILSDHCANTSLPRTRPKSAFVGDQEPPQSTSNLNRMSLHSRSTTSLMAGRKKKAAPLPPPVPVSPANSVVAQSEKPSPLVASQSDISAPQESIVSSNLTPTQNPRDSIPPFPLESSTPVRVQSEEKSLESTDSGIVQDTPSHRKVDEEEFGFNSPPPPPVLDEIQNEDVSVTEINERIVVSTNAIKTDLTEDIKPNITFTETCTNPLNKNIIIEESNTKENILIKPVKSSVGKTSISNSITTGPPVNSDVRKVEPAPSPNISKQLKPETELADIDWHYQLPSPPKAFRDSSPEHLIVNETSSVIEFKDSVVTSPELFEKLRSLEDNQSEKDTFKSEITSIASEEPLNMLSLEHLEKRKSLVYNRELATSLKIPDPIEPSIKTADNFTSSSTSFQTTFDELKKAVVQQNQPPKPARTTVTSSHPHTLSNFKISTYDVPKENITVFEDDTIRSNAHNMPSTLTRNKLGRSMDNVSISKKVITEESSNNAEREYTFYRPKTSKLGTLSSVSRSESFSTDPRLPLNPVSRSKSTLMLNKPPITKINETSSISRSNSLFDVSGLQSLEVMRLIQNKLNTPTGSLENISYREKTQTPYVPQKPLPPDEIKQTEPPSEPQPAEENPRPPSPPPVKKYYYRGPPAVNMTTWSERPKVPVSVKEDEDYTLGNANISSKLIVNTTNNNITSNNSIEVRNNENRNVSVHVNGFDHITQPSNNVVIKIGGNHTNTYSKNFDNQRFLAPTAYRKPFSNINRNGSSVTSTQRPHSIALPSDFDISRVPVVRSVEFKKPFKDFHGGNTSITHISHGNDDYRSLDTSDSYVDKFRSTEHLKSIERQDSESNNKRVFRVGSFKPVESHPAPVIRGFKSSDRGANNRFSWNPSSDYNTLPAQPKAEKEYTTNQHVPFSQSTLKRTASSKIYADVQIYNDMSKPVVKQDRSYIEESSYSSLPSALPHSKPIMATAPPPPPQMPKATLKKVSSHETKSPTSPLEPRDMLLDSIRNFGGKKGLRSVKA